MDPGRRLIRVLAALSLVAPPLAGCALAKGSAPAPLASLAPPTDPPPLAAEQALCAPPPQPVPEPPERTFVTMAPIPDPVTRAAGRTEPARTQGPSAIAAANRAAREPSRASGFLGGVQLFAYGPGRVYEVWTAPLRVTTLTLGEGETIVAMAAGDTIRWQIGETTSGAGAGQRAHVMVKPLSAGLETNLALTTSRRLYLLQLRSGSVETFNAAVAWDVGAVLPPPVPSGEPPRAAAAATVTPDRALDARFAIRPKGRRPAWTPSAVMTDGVRTFLAFPPGASATEAPALFAVDPAGQTQMVNYRQQGGLWVVDRVLDRAELRLGGRRGQVVRIERRGGAS